MSLDDLKTAGAKVVGVKQTESPSEKDGFGRVYRGRCGGTHHGSHQGRMRKTKC